MSSLAVGSSKVSLLRGLMSGCITLDELEREPGLAVLKLYKAHQEELESLTFEKGSLKIELQRVQRQSEAVREEAEVLRLREKELEVSVKKVECEVFTVSMA